MSAGATVEPGCPQLTALCVREILESDRPDWVRLRDALWPDCLWDHEVETRKHFETPAPGAAVFVAVVDQRLVGFLEMRDRNYAPGCTSSPVPFIEGWYVEPQFRRRGIGRALADAAEARAVAEGHREIASDTELDNANSIAAHCALGYEEVERIVCFQIGRAHV